MKEQEKPSEKYTDEPLLDHEYDGIREADNPLPRWWVYMFVISIVFAIVYLPAVHMFDILPHEELSESIALATRQQEARDLELEASGALDKDPVAAGRKYFSTFCVTCHGQNAEGGLCPNLTDAYWIHGPYEKDIVNTITNGVSAKGMPQWGPVLGDRKIKMLAAYVMTLWEKPPPVKGKKAEGSEYDMATIRAPKAATQAVADTTKSAPQTPASKEKKKT